MFKTERAMPAMNNDSKQYDLGERAFRFTKDIRMFAKRLPRNICNLENGKQLIRASGSIGANNIEANEALAFVSNLTFRICFEFRYLNLGFQ
jgi:hypothetical protein